MLVHIHAQTHISRTQSLFFAARIKFSLHLHYTYTLKHTHTTTYRHTHSHIHISNHNNIHSCSKSGHREQAKNLFGSLSPSFRFPFFKSFVVVVVLILFCFGQCTLSCSYHRRDYFVYHFLHFSQCFFH